MRDVIKFRNGALTELFPGPGYETLESLLPWVRTWGGSACHYGASTPMGLDNTAPVDVRMKVRGVQNLRIVGPAINPGKASPGMQVLACVLAEKAVDLIKEDHGIVNEH